MKAKWSLIIGVLVLLLSVFAVFVGDRKGDEQIESFSRYDKIPSDVVKVTPAADAYPPIVHSDEFEEPVPLGGAVNSAGAEDSPFITVNRGDELFFVFISDVGMPPEKQLLDGVSGIWMSKKINGVWGEPERVLLQESGKVSLDGCVFVQGNTMIFCSAREGYTGMHWFSAELKDGKWINWRNIDFDPTYDVGELHIHEDELYYHSGRAGGKGGSDIWMLKNANGEWRNPVNVEAVNSAENEGMPYLTADGLELWFNREYKGSPAVYRSVKINGSWQQPELIVSKFAGEPTLDNESNLYFVHHFYRDGKMIESDIYVAYKK